MALTRRFMFRQTNMRTVAWTIEPDAWWELSLWEETFSQSQILKRCGGFFLMSSVLLWQFIWIGIILLHRCKKKKKTKKEKSNKRANKQKIHFLCSSECNVQFQPIKEFKLVKNNEKIKMVSMSVFKIKQMCQLPSSAVESLSGVVTSRGRTDFSFLLFNMKLEPSAG